MRSKIKFIPITLILLLIAFFYSINLNCKYYKCLVFPDKNLWKIIDTYEDNKNSWRGILEHPNYLVRLYKVGNVNNESATEYTKITLMAIKGLFDTAKSPYAGEISDKITCSGDLKPEDSVFQSKSGNKIYYMVSYLNDRFQYGACTENQISYKVFSGTFYCESVSEWYQIEIIVPKEKVLEDGYYKELFVNSNCQRPSVNTGKLLP